MVSKKYTALAAILLSLSARGNSGAFPGFNKLSDTTPVLKCTIIRELPHDSSFFTEGLCFYNGNIMESTGSPWQLPLTKTMIVQTDPLTGKSIQKVILDEKKYFGEGITFWNHSCYQLTYKNKTGFIYDAGTFKQTGSFHYRNTEGWGITSNNTHLVISDGTDTLSFIDPVSLQQVKLLKVTNRGTPVININELEYINGFIYANIWQSAFIIKIDPSSGKVLAWIDLSPIVKEVKKIHPKAASLNGIAWDARNDAIYITGKFWPKIYQVSFPH